MEKQFFSHAKKKFGLERIKTKRTAVYLLLRQYHPHYCHTRLQDIFMDTISIQFSFEFYTNVYNVRFYLVLFAWDESSNRNSKVIFPHTRLAQNYIYTSLLG